MQNFANVSVKVLLLTMLAISLAACMTLQKGRVTPTEATEVIVDLPGTQGKTVEDQRRIDRTIAKGCASGIVSIRQCDMQTQASAARKAELKTP